MTGRRMRAGAISRSTPFIADAGGEVFDPLSGYADLAARRVRFIGDAAERIREDYLRILRFFRFTADYAEGPPDAPGLAACVRGREGLAILSGERVRQEMLRLLAARRGPELVRWMLRLRAAAAGAGPGAPAGAARPAGGPGGGAWPRARCHSPPCGAGRRGAGGRGAPAEPPAPFQRGRRQAHAGLHASAGLRSRCFRRAQPRPSSTPAARPPIARACCSPGPVPATSPRATPGAAACHCPSGGRRHGFPSAAPM